MPSVRLHTRNGGTWVMSRCQVCGEVHKHPIEDAINGRVECAKCGHSMDLREATIDAVAAADASRLSSGPKSRPLRFGCA